MSEYDTEAIGAACIPSRKEIDEMARIYLGECGPQANRVYNFTRAVLARWSVVQTSAAAPDSPRYRLLESGVDRIEENDQFLSVDGVTWFVDGAAPFVGYVYYGKSFLPARRPLPATQSIDA